MFPPTDPFASGILPVSDGNTIYWEASGNPDGIPALHLHGGPGGGNGAGYRKLFDPDTYLIVSFDQRGCGRSRPRAIDRDAELSTNTTQALINDIEALRVHLNVEQWLVTGMSWGTTLGLAYAQAHPDRLIGIILFAVTTTTPGEITWITESMGNIFPQEWDRFAAASHRQPGQRLIDAYYERITCDDPAIRSQAAREWCRWEDTHISLDPNRGPMLGDDDLAFVQNFATLVIHYWKHGAFLGDREILDNMDRIGHIPGVLIHGHLDISSPLRTAWQLHQAWPASRLVVVDGEGHGGPHMVEEMARAIAGFASSKHRKIKPVQRDKVGRARESTQ